MQLFTPRRRSCRHYPVDHVNMMCTLTVLELPLPVPDPPSMQVVRQSVPTEPWNAWHPHGRHQCDSQSLVRVQVTRAYRGTAAAGSNVTRRQHRDDWPYWRAPLHHMHLGDRAFAQIPPILSGKPPPKSKSVTFGRFWRARRGLKPRKTPTDVAD